MPQGCDLARLEGCGVFVPSEVSGDVFMLNGLVYLREPIAGSVVVLSSGFLQLFSNVVNFKCEEFWDSSGSGQGKRGLVRLRKDGVESGARLCFERDVFCSRR